MESAKEQVNVEEYISEEEEQRRHTKFMERFCMEAEEKFREGCRATIEACFSLEEMSSILLEEFQKWPYVKNE